MGHVDLAFSLILLGVDNDLPHVCRPIMGDFHSRVVGAIRLDVLIGPAVDVASHR